MCLTLCLLATYALVHSFLHRREHKKAAKYLKEAAKDIIELKDDDESEVPLERIVREWKLLTHAGTLLCIQLLPICMAS